MVLMNLGGAAYQLINAMPPTELYAGATVNSVPLDPVSNILLKLHHRFAQQDIVTRMSAMSEMLHFRREGGEGINTTLTRFEVIRNRAVTEGQFVMSIEAYTVMLINQCRLTAHQVHNLLLPYQGSFPNDEEQFQAFIQGVHRIGLLHDDSPGTLGSIVGGRHRPMFLTDASDDAGGMGTEGGDHAPADTGAEHSSGIFTTWSWDAEDPAGDGAEGGLTYTFPSAQAEMSDSSSATSSDDGVGD